MNTVNILGLLCVILYVVNDFVRNRDLFNDKKLFFLSIYNGLFLIVIVMALLIDYNDWFKFWWIIIILGSPSFYYHYLRIKRSKELNRIKFIKLAVMIILIVIIALKVN